MSDAAAMERAHAILDPIAEDYLSLPDVDIGVMFGSEGLRVRGKVFAFVSFRGALTLKLPQARVDELDGGEGTHRMVMRARPMREWLTVSVDAAEQWRPLVGEAYAFVDSITPRGTADGEGPG